MLQKISGLLLMAMLALSMIACKERALAGTNWVLIGWSEGSLKPSDFKITAKFSESGISGTAAVNNYGGTYSAANGEFSVGSLQSTQMGGPEPAMRAEQSYLGLLGQARKYRLEQGRLSLLDAKGKELLHFQAEK